MEFKECVWKNIVKTIGREFTTWPPNAPHFSRERCNHLHIATIGKPQLGDNWNLVHVTLIGLDPFYSTKAQTSHYPQQEQAAREYTLSSPMFKVAWSKPPTCGNVVQNDA